MRKEATQKEGEKEKERRNTGNVQMVNGKERESQELSSANLT